MSISLIYTHDTKEGRTTKAPPHLREKFIQRWGPDQEYDQDTTASTDGRYTTYLEVRGMAPVVQNLMLRDNQTGQTIQINPASSLFYKDQNCASAQISANGKYIVFNMHQRKKDGRDDFSSRINSGIFLYDIEEGGITQVSPATTKNNQVFIYSKPAISADGKTIAFETWLRNGTSAEEFKAASDIFLRKIN